MNQPCPKSREELELENAALRERLNHTRQSYNALCDALGVPTGPPILEWAKRWRERNEKVEELLREYLSCPAEWYDARVKYSPVQVDHYLRAEARAVLGLEREEEPYQPVSGEKHDA